MVPAPPTRKRRQWEDTQAAGDVGGGLAGMTLPVLTLGGHVGRLWEPAASYR